MDRVALENCLPDLCGSMRQVFAWAIWWDEYREAFDSESFFPPRAIVLQVVRTASYEASLFNVRKLSEFFHSNQGRLDDLRAQDYQDYPPKKLFDPDLIRELHKRLAHQTTLPAEYDVEFNMTNLQLKTGQESLEFLQHVASQFKPTNSFVLEQIAVTIDFLEEQIERVRRIQSEQSA